MLQFLKQVLAAADASVNQAGAALNTTNVFSISMQAVNTGSSTGALKLQFSNDIVNPSIPAAAPTNWSDISGATVTVDSAAVFAIPKTDLCYEWVRVVYTKNNGSAGTISVNVKTLGY